MCPSLLPLFFFCLLHSDVQLTEEAVRRYLIRKPMTTKDLLKKFQTKRTGLSNEQTVNVLAQILKRLNPERKNVNDKMHFYLTEWLRFKLSIGWFMYVLDYATSGLVQKLVNINLSLFIMSRNLSNKIFKNCLQFYYVVKQWEGGKQVFVFLL